MDIDDSPEEAAYRRGVRAFLEERARELVHGTRWPQTAEEVLAHRRTQRVLCEGGYVGVAWPRRHGGRDGTAMQQVIVEQELARAGVPRLINLVALGMCGPVLMVHGTEEQRERLLPPMLTAETVWCQLFSEPGAGSDLAAVSTRAVRGEAGWRIRGQKVWTSGAQYADLGLLLARSNPEAPRHRGLTMLALDMRAPGVTVRPLRQLTGDSEFSEVFLDGVEVPDAMRVGEVDGGWAVALTTLMNERMTIGGAGTEHAATIEQLLAHAARRIPALPAARAAVLRQELARCWTEAVANRATGYRRVTRMANGGTPGPEASTGKLTSTALAARVADLGVRLCDDAALAGGGDAGFWRHAQAFALALSIAGGTSEVLRNVVGERVLGLPSEPRPVAAATPGR